MKKGELEAKSTSSPKICILVLVMHRARGATKKGAVEDAATLLDSFNLAK
jgi:hypothetical protein